jgi:hypothetical protein
MNPSRIVTTGLASALCALGVVAGATSVAGVAAAVTPFNGTYTGVLKVAGQPDQVSLWNVMSTCQFQSCVAHVITRTVGSDWLFDGTQWTRLAVPQTGICNGASVPAISAHQTLTPKGDGSFAGAVTSTVNCNGTTVDVTQALSLTPA